MFKKFLAFTILSLFSSVSIVHADGMVLPREGNYYTHEADQKAAIFFKNNREDMYLSIGTKGSANEFAWIVPTPSKPDVNEAPSDLFNDLDKKTQKKDKLYEKIFKWLGIDSGGSGYSDEIPSGNVDISVGTKSQSSTVRVVEQKYNLGMYDTATLKSEKADDLYEWLKDNNYNVPENGTSILEEYISKGWYFVAMKISDDYKTDKVRSEILSSNVRPIKLSFDSSKMTFPLKISSIEASTGNNTLTEIENKIFSEMSLPPETTVASNRLISAGIEQSKITEWKSMYQEYLQTKDPKIIKDDIHKTVSGLAAYGIERLKIAYGTSYQSNYDQVSILLYVFTNNRVDADNYNATTQYASKMSERAIKKISVDQNWTTPAGGFYLTKLRISLAKQGMTKDLLFKTAMDQKSVNTGSMTIFEWILTLLLILSLLLYAPFILFVKIAPWFLILLYVAYLVTFISLLVRQFMSAKSISRKMLIVESHLLSIIYFPIVAIVGLSIYAQFDSYADTSQPFIFIIPALASLVFSLITVFLLRTLQLRVLRKREEGSQNLLKQGELEAKIKKLEEETEVLRSKLDKKN
ncbi:MAG: DUF2330 domain-containing protein [bacterium]|nr:DUF2330 domain-containing protein [bacterium]